MAKRKEPPASEGAPEWMATFSDLMNLLLCFFVLLFASSTMDEGKVQEIAASFNNMTFSIFNEKTIQFTSGELVSGGVTQLPNVDMLLEEVGKEVESSGESESDEPGGGKPDDNMVDNNTASNTDASPMSEEEIKSEYDSKGKEQSEEIYEEITQLSESINIDDEIIMDFTSQYVSMDLNGAILFDNASADIKEEAKTFLTKIASILQKYKYCVIEIEGHTDNIPINTGEFDNNRDLSSERARNVYEYIMTQGNFIDPNMKISGYGDSRPIASNSTDEGRSRNRRVVIKIYNQQNSNY